MVLATRPVDRRSPDVEAAVVFIDRHHALIARMRDGHPFVDTLSRAADDEDVFLGLVAHEIADCERVLIMGPESARLAFEREYVGLAHRPDRFVEIDCALSVDAREMFDRLRLLTA